jgi:uncharacterized membrane protein
MSTYLRLIPRYFFRGALLTVPVAATLYILYELFRAFDGIVPVGIPGLGLLVTFSFVTLIGFLSSSVIGRTTFDLTERALRKVPLVKLLYNSIKDLVGAFVGNKKSFNRPVTVRFGPGDIYALGFVTRDDVAVLNKPGHVAVYFPQSYNVAGNLILIPRDAVETLPIQSSELMTFIVSGGVSGLGMGQSLVPPKEHVEDG